MTAVPIMTPASLRGGVKWKTSDAPMALPPQATGRGFARGDL